MPGRLSIAVLSAVLALPGSVAVAMSRDGSLAAAIVPKADGTGTSSQLLLPYFEVDSTNPGGRTTLMAIVNHDAEARFITVHYFDARFEPFKEVVLTLGANATLTINLRDITDKPVDADGWSRGTVAVIARAPTARLSGDYFLVDPAQSFAQGNRMFAFGRGIYCKHWQFRIAMGGAFSGGTWLTVFMPKPATQPGPHFEVSLLNEAGSILGSTPYNMPDNVARIPAIRFIRPVLDPFPDSFFGSVRIRFNERFEGGLVLGEWNADGRFQVGFNGTCLD